MAENKDMWITENHLDTYLMKFRLEERLFSGKSDFQKVEVVRTKDFGKMLFVDDFAMISEREEWVYHDMIVHPAMFTHPNPKRALVIGGGDGGTAREVLRHPGLEKTVMVEIDGMVVDACKQHIPQTACAFDNPALELHIDDGLKYMAAAPDKSFDVIFVDSTDPIGPAAPLFGESFYQDVYRVLSDDGIVVSQGESSFMMVEEQKSIFKSMKAVFPKTFAFNYNTLVYPGGLWTFAMATKGLNPVKDFNPERVTQSGMEFKYYNQNIHRGAFCLPSFQRELLVDYLSDQDL